MAEPSAGLPDVPHVGQLTESVRIPEHAPVLTLELARVLARVLELGHVRVPFPDDAPAR